MPINLQDFPVKLMCSDHAIAKMYCENHVIYSSGNTVTYCVDSGKSYQEEVDEGESCLAPKTFTPAKPGWTFVGWRTDQTANGSVLSDRIMGDDPVTLYAVFRQTVTVTYYNGSTTAGSTSGYKIYNNGNIANPAFTISPASLSGWSFRGWATSNAAAAGIAYSAISNTQFASSVTLYAAYGRTLTLTYAGNGATGGATAAQTGTQYYNTGNYSNPSFTLSANGFSKTGYNFSKWALGSAGGTQYAVGASVTLSGNTTFYAVWTMAKTPYYVVKNQVSQQSIPFYVNSASNMKVFGFLNSGDTYNIESGNTATKFNGTTNNNNGSSFVCTLKSLPTKGCDKLRVIGTISNPGYISCNGTTYEKDGYNQSYDFNVSGKTSVDITCSASMGASGGSPSFDFYEIQFY